MRAAAPLLLGLALPPPALRNSAPRLSADAEGRDFDLLNRRIGEMKAVNSVAHLVLPEVLLPGQRMRLSLMPTELSDIVRSNKTIGVLGTDEGMATLTHGVEAHVSELTREFNDAGYGDAVMWSATLSGGRIFERQAEATSDLTTVAAAAAVLRPTSVWEEEVKWVDLGLADALSAARSPSRAVTLLARELSPLVEQWLELARGDGATLWGKQRSAASTSWGGVDPVDKVRLNEVVDRMLSTLGEMPSIDRPSERALWIAALCNPCGADQRAWPVMDIRPAVLTASTPLERLCVAKTGLVDSIYKLKGGSWPMKTYYW